jgi:hypothetical protein
VPEMDPGWLDKLLKERARQSENGVAPAPAVA